VFYRVRDPRIFQLLAVTRQILTSNVADTHSALEGLHDATPASPDPADPRRNQVAK